MSILRQFHENLFKLYEEDVDFLENNVTGLDGGWGRN